jgi:hypothetical protein
MQRISNHLKARMAAVLLLSGCGPVFPDGHSHPVLTGRDSMLMTERRLIGLVSYVDAFGRESTGLPPSLDPVIERSQAAAERTVDVWGRAVRYSTDGRRLELRSAGADAAFSTSDDIVVSGQLGRAVPCEVHTEGRTFNYDDLAPPCGESLGVILLLCPELEHADAAEASLSALSDPAAATGRRLVGLARRMDWHGRRVGGAPPSLRAVFGFRELVDAWGQPVRYAHRGLNFELRSEGMDGVLGTLDDIIVSSRFGLPIDCYYRDQNGLQSCEAPPPPCPMPSTLSATPPIPSMNASRRSSGRLLRG